LGPEGGFCRGEPLHAAKAETIRDVADHIARSADAALTRRVRVFDHNSTLIAVAGASWWGDNSATAAICVTEVRLQAAFKGSPHDLSKIVR